MMSMRVSYSIKTADKAKIRLALFNATLNYIIGCPGIHISLILMRVRSTVAAVILNGSNLSLSCPSSSPPSVIEVYVRVFWFITWCQWYLPANTRHWPMLFSFWANVVDSGPASKLHWVNVLCLLGCGGSKALFFSEENQQYIIAPPHALLRCGNGFRAV